MGKENGVWNGDTSKNRSNKRNKWKTEILAFIKKYTDEHHYPPTFREIGEGVGLKSTASVKYYIDMMESSGMITKNEGSSRSICAVEPVEG